MSGRKTFIRGRIPIALEIILLMVPVLLGTGLYLHHLLNSEVCSYEMQHWPLIMRQVLSTEAERLTSLEKAAGEDGIDIRAAEIEDADLLARNLTFSGPLTFCLSKKETMERQRIITLKIAVREEGEPVQLIDPMSGQLIDLDMESDYGKSVEEALSAQKLVERVLNDDGRRTRAMFFMIPAPKPVRYNDISICKGGEGSSLVLCATIDEDEEEKDYTSQTLFATSIGIIGMCLILLILCTLIFRELSALTPIRRSLEAPIRGKEAENQKDILKAISRSETSELTDLLESFQLMSESSRIYQSSVSSIMELYDPILPKAMLDWFGKADIRDISPGDEAAVDGTALLLSMEDAPGKGVMFPVRNQLIAGAADAVLSCGGIITVLGYRHIAAMFPESTEQAMEAAGKVLSLPVEGSGVRRVLVSAHKGVFHYSVTGTRDSMSVRMDPGEYGLLTALQELQEEKKLGPLCTEPAAEGSRETRRLWILPDGIRIFELLIGSGRDTDLKRETLEVFEASVESFDKGNYQDASSGFLSVLRVNRRDTAAAYYLELCEEKERV